MRKGFALALLSMFLLSPLAARAASIGFSDTFGPLAVPFPATALATLSLFDPALGTLTMVTLAIDASTSGGSISWDNEALIATDVTLGIGAEVTAVGLAGLTALAVPLQTGSAVGIDADNDGAADFVGTDSFAFAIAQIFFSDGFDTTVLNSALGPYTGIGTFDLTLTASLIETIDANKTGGGGLIGVTENALRPTGAAGPDRRPGAGFSRNHHWITSPPCPAR